MRALTVKQPWASLIACGIKQIENRTYPVPKTVRGERVAIHAGRGWDVGALAAMPEQWADYFRDEVCRIDGFAPSEAERRVNGARAVAGRILCTARIVGQIRPGIDFEFFGVSNGSTARDCPKCSNVVHWGIEPVCDRCDGTRSKYWCDLNADFYENLPGVYGWILADVELVEDPRIHRGMLGFWEVKP